MIDSLLSVVFSLIYEYLDISIKVPRNDHLPLLILLGGPLLARCLLPPLNSLQYQLRHRSKERTCHHCTVSSDSLIVIIPVLACCDCLAKYNNFSN